MTKPKYNVSILVDGKPVKEYSKDGKTFIESKFGTEYSIRLKNNTGKRVLAILSVDSINAITGVLATPSDTGYVINAFSSETIQGYRQNTEGGARFKFTQKSTGYVKEAGGSEANSGVIGVTFVEEYVKVPTYIFNAVEKRPFVSPFRRVEPNWGTGPNFYTNDNVLGDNINLDNIRSSSIRSIGEVGETKSSGMRENRLNFCSVVDTSPVPAATSYCAVQSPEPKGFDSATTWGESFSEHLSYVDFTRSGISEVVNLYYATAESLKEMGVIKDSPPAINFPQSFPGFAKPPTGWKS